jgi:hypothetical protein
VPWAFLSFDEKRTPSNIRAWGPLLPHGQAYLAGGRPSSSQYSITRVAAASPRWPRSAAPHPALVRLGRMYARPCSAPDRWNNDDEGVFCCGSTARRGMNSLALACKSCGAPRCKALPCLRNIKTGFIAASIHYQTDCPGPSLARVIAPRLSALVSAAPR